MTRQPLDIAPLGRDLTEPADLLHAARRGDPTAWILLVGRYERLLTWAARSFGLSAADAQDAVQLTWMRCVEHLDQVTRPEQLGSWLVTICRRECMRLRSRSLREIPVAEPGDRLCDASVYEDDVEMDVLDRMEQDRLALLLGEALATLTLRERRLVEMLLRPDPPPYADIGRQLGMPVGSIGPVRMRALGKLRSALDDAREHR